MTNEKVLRRKKDFSIRLTKALKVYNEILCPLISMLNINTNNPRNYLMKHSEKDRSVSIHHENSDFTSRDV